MSVTSVIDLFHAQTKQKSVAWEIIQILKKQNGLSNIQLTERLTIAYDNNPTLAYSDDWRNSTDTSKEKLVRDALKLLGDNELIVSARKGNANRHELSAEGRELIESNEHPITEELLLSFLGSIISDHNYEAFGLRNTQTTPNSFFNHQNWSEKVRIVTNGFEFQSHKDADEDVLTNVYKCLFEGKKFNAVYKNQGDINQDVIEKKTYRFSPHWLVARGGVLYLVATLWNYKDLRHFAVHRLSDIEPLDESVTLIDGTLEEYIKTGVFQYPVDKTKEKVILKVRIAPSVSYIFEEKYLSEDQEMTIVSETAINVSATVLDTWELRYWLLSLSANIEVLEPACIRNWMAGESKKLAAIYSSE